MTAQRHFASDNQAGVHPDVLKALAAINAGHEPSYGHGPTTDLVEDLFQRHFGWETKSYLVFNGTAANVIGLQSVVQPHHAIICGENAHLNVDECGAPERFTGCKLLTVPTPDGKLKPLDVANRVTGIGDEHRVQPRVVSITQSTEIGTVYTIAEIEALSAVAREHKLLLHMDGSRIANAAVSLKSDFRSFTTDAGVDIVSFGGTKNGLMGAEAILFLNGLAPDDFLYIRKQGMQLGSKMRFMAAQFLALLGTDLWKRNATNANRMAQRLAEQVSQVPGIRITQSVDANGVFAIVPEQHVAALQQRAMFYVWNPAISEVRWMTAWDTTEDDVDQFASAVREIVRVMRWRALLLLALAIVPVQLLAQDSVPAPPVVDSAAVARDSALAAKAAESERARQDSILYGKPPVSPMGALWRSILISGWGQAKLNRKLTGALFVTWEGVTLGMSLKTSHELRYLRRTKSGSVAAKEQERQDWLVLLAFNHLFSAIEGYVSAHLWDFPDDLQVRAVPVPGGVGGTVSVPFRFP